MTLNNFALGTQPSTHQIEPKKMEEIIDFILQGKYSSACLLLLESTGQEPRHYIPYRTYNRLQNQRQQAVRCNIEAKKTLAPGKRYSEGVALPSRLNDLDYVETISDKTPSMQGGLAAYTRRSAILEVWLSQCPHTASGRWPYFKSCQNGNNF